MRDIDPAIVAELSNSVIRPIFFVSIDFDTPLRFSSGFGPITVDGVEYFGGANVGRITSTKENTDLDPNQIEITVSAVNQAALSAVGDSNYMNRDVEIKVGFLDENGALVGSGATLNYFLGKTDEVKYTYGKKASINIVARDRLADWSRPRVERNMNADQQARYPGDVGFEFVGQVTDKQIIWPKGEYFE